MANLKDKMFSGKKKKTGNKADGGKRVLSGMLFAAACFVAVFVLLEFHEIYWVVGIACAFLMGAAFWFLDSMFGDKDDIFDELAEAQEQLEREKEEDRKKADDEFKRKIEEQVSSLDRTSRAMFEALKRSADIQENHLSKMQIKIDQVIIDQNAGVRTMIKFNKENARQMALSEKATLEEIATRIPAATKNVVVAPEVPEDYVPDRKFDEEDENNYFYHNNEEESGDISLDAFESLLPPDEPEEAEVVDTEPVLDAGPVIDEVIEETVVEEPVIEESIIEGTVTEEPVIEEPSIEELLLEEPVIEETPTEETVIGEPIIEEVAAEEPGIEEAVAEEPVIEEPVIEEPVIEEPAVEETVIEEAVPEETAVEETAVEEPVIEGIVSEEAVTEEPAIDIDTLLSEAMAGDAPVEAEPEPEPEAVSEPEPVQEAAPEPAAPADMFAGTGVDLSNPNANLSADDIAKLFAAAAGK